MIDKKRIEKLLKEKDVFERDIQKLADIFLEKTGAPFLLQVESDKVRVALVINVEDYQVEKSL